MIIIPLLLIFFTCLFIWRACDGFETASEYIGRNLSEGVRGGTINAISSSVPELLTTLIALFLLSDQDGFAVGIGTTAGSALFNGMIIPAACILAVVGTVVMGKKVQSVNVSPKVILRDGISLILAELLLIFCLRGTQLVWWQGAVLMLFYFGYLFYMLSSMKKVAGGGGDEEVEEDNEEEGPMGLVGKIFYWLSLGPVLDLEGMMIRDKHREKMKSETWNAWPLLLASVGVIAFACYLLVEACLWLGSGPASPYHFFGAEVIGIGMPPLFVAVIFASMATSVPDTVMSLRDARDGDYDDAVANALGSNIFDICFALGFPLFLYTLLNGPIEMTPEVASQSTELRSALLILTILGFLIYFVGKRIKVDGVTLIPLHRWRAVVLLVLYLSFLVYIVGRSAQADWAMGISSFLQNLIN